MTRKTYDIPLSASAFPTDSLVLAEGQRLATVRGCYNGCHGEGLKGGVLRSAPVTEGTGTEIRLGPLARLGLVLGKYNPQAELIDHDAPRPAVRDTSDHLTFGKYLALTSCTECHGLDLRGNPDMSTPSLAIAATYSEEDFAIDALRGGFERSRTSTYVGCGATEVQSPDGGGGQGLAHLPEHDRWIGRRWGRFVSTGDVGVPGELDPRASPRHIRSVAVGQGRFAIASVGLARWRMSPALGSCGAVPLDQESPGSSPQGATGQSESRRSSCSASSYRTGIDAEQRVERAAANEAGQERDQAEQRPRGLRAEEVERENGDAEQYANRAVGRAFVTSKQS